jgi:hypothetical protein
MNPKILFAAALVIAVLAVGRMAAQTVSFGYDPAGNRISRVIDMGSSNRAPRAGAGDTDETETPPPFVEQLTPDLQVKIYPNPTKGLLQVELAGNADENAQIQVFSQAGQQIFTCTAGGTRTPVDLSACPSGVYILRLIINEKTENYTIIKK